MNKFNVVLTIVSITVFASTGFTDAHIPTHCRVSNEAPGWCLWSAIETVARAQGIKELYGLKESRKKDPDAYIEHAKWENNRWNITREFVSRNSGTLESVLDKFERIRFNRFRCQNYGTFNKNILLTALKNGRGAVVQVNWEDKGNLFVHAVVVTHLDEKEVRFINSNNLQEEKRSREWWNKNWDGFVITLE